MFNGTWNLNSSVWLLLSCFPLLASCRGSWRGFLSAHRVTFCRILALTTNNFFSLNIISHYHLFVSLPLSHTHECLLVQSEISLLPILLLEERIGLSATLKYNWNVSPCSIFLLSEMNSVYYMKMILCGLDYKPAAVHNEPQQCLWETTFHLWSSCCFFTVNMPLTCLAVWYIIIYTRLLTWN